MPRTFCSEVQAFAAGSAHSAVIELTPCDEARRQCQAFGLPTEALRLRLIRVRLKGGEEEFLITSLLDEQAFPTPLFKHLYHLRWGIEIDQPCCLHKSVCGWTAAPSVVCRSDHRRRAIIGEIGGGLSIQVSARSEIERE